MSELIYTPARPDDDRPLVLLGGSIKSPPFSPVARRATGMLLRRVQRGERLWMPHSRPMPALGARCHELRIPDGGVDWRIMYRVDREAVLILDVFAKTTQKTPDHVIATCRTRLRRYEAIVRRSDEGR